MKQDLKETWRGDWRLQVGVHLRSHHCSWGESQGGFAWGQDASNSLPLEPCSSARGQPVQRLLTMSWSVHGWVHCGLSTADLLPRYLLGVGAGRGMFQC